MKKPFAALFLAFICHVGLQGQIIFDDNASTQNSPATSQLVFSDFVVPQGINRLLVVTAWDSNSISSISFNGANLSKAINGVSRPLNIWYIVLGTGVAITSNIQIDYSEQSTDAFAIASSFQNVKQENSLGSQTTANGFAGDGFSFNVAGTEMNSLIVSGLRTANIPNASPAGDQSLISENTGSSTALYSAYQTEDPPSGSDVFWNWNGGSDFYLVAKEFVYDNTFLPVELVTFFGELAHQGVTLTWETASEWNNEGFEIQRSVNGIHWTGIDFINGKGTSHEVNQYTYHDGHPSPGINYYRLKQMDYDGAFEFSNIISVSGEERKSIGVFPNPAHEVIQISGAKEGQYILLDYLGRQVKEGFFETPKINIADLPKGMYMLRLRSGEQWETRKILKK